MAKYKFEAPKNDAGAVVAAGVMVGNRVYMPGEVEITDEREIKALEEAGFNPSGGSGKKATSSDQKSEGELAEEARQKAVADMAAATQGTPAPSK